LNAWQNRNVFRSDLKVSRVSLSVTVRGRQFQVPGAEQRTARLPKTVLMANGSDSAVAENEPDVSSFDVSAEI